MGRIPQNGAKDVCSMGRTSAPWGENAAKDVCSMGRIERQNGAVTRGSPKTTTRFFASAIPSGPTSLRGLPLI